MELYLQFGYGMMEHCRSLIAAWGGGTSILSPRDLNDSQLRRLASEIKALPGGGVLLDPQFYLPHSDHERLCAHAFWPKDYESGAFWGGPGLTRLLGELGNLNVALGARAFVLPGLLASKVDDDWLAVQASVIDEARSAAGGAPLMATLALSSDALHDDEQLTRLIEESRHWDVPGFYVVCEHPRGDYLVGDPVWVTNVLDLVAALRMRRTEVILGYCNHQMLIAACAGATAIASGTWMNVRSFPPDKFKAAYEDEVKQRATWYYCPQGLSEYKIPFLDIASRQGVLALMAPAADLGSAYASALFAGPAPSSIGFTEQAAFRHYLQCLRGQVGNASDSSFDETIRRHENLLTAAETLLQTLAAAGVRGQHRDFREIVDVNRAALSVFARTRGPTLRRAWPTLMQAQK